MDVHLFWHTIGTRICGTKFSIEKTTGINNHFDEFFDLEYDWRVIQRVLKLRNILHVDCNSSLTYGHWLSAHVDKPTDSWKLSVTFTNWSDHWGKIQIVWWYILWMFIYGTSFYVIEYIFIPEVVLMVHRVLEWSVLVNILREFLLLCFS